MQEIKVSELKPHSKNDYFFDDMTGQKWTEFIESVKTSGIIEPIVITQDKIIVSGHQRVRACRELNIENIMAEIRIYDNEDKIIKDLIETNLRQRGDISSSSLKMGRIICELERIYGIRQGRPEKTSDIVGIKTQESLAKELGISVDTLNNFKKLTTLIPEIQDMVNTDKISTSVASRIIARLSPTDQQQLILTYGKDEIENATQKKTQDMIDKMQELENKNKGYEIKLQKVKELENNIKVLKEKLDNRPTVTETIEVKPNDYDSTKKSLEDYKKDYKGLQNEYDKKVGELNNLKEQIKAIQSVTEEEKYAKKLKDSTIYFCARIDDFIEKTGGFCWLSDHVNELPDMERKSYIKAVNVMENWVQAIKENINQYSN